jgi:uncharacterized protein
LGISARASQRGTIVVVPALPSIVAAAAARFAAEVRALVPGVIELCVFGSYARGESTHDSDIDLWVVLDEVTPALKRAVLDLAADISLDTELALSPTVVSRAQVERWRADDRRLVRDVATDGVAL